MWVEIQSRNKRREKASTIRGEKPEDRARIACGLVTDYCRAARLMVSHLGGC